MPGAACANRSWKGVYDCSRHLRKSLFYRWNFLGILIHQALPSIEAHLISNAPRLSTSYKITVVSGGLLPLVNINLRRSALGICGNLRRGN